MAETHRFNWGLHPNSAEHCGLVADVHHTDGGVTVRLVGEFDITGIDVFDRMARSLVFRYDGRQIDVDCADLLFIDAVGVGRLVRLASSVQQGRVTLAGVPVQVRDVLRFTQTDTLFDFAECSRLEGSTVTEGRSRRSALHLVDD